MIATDINNNFEFKAFLLQLGNKPLLGDFIQASKELENIEFSHKKATSFFYLIKAIDYFFPIKDIEIEILYESYHQYFANNIFSIFNFDFENEELYNFFLKNDEAIVVLEKSISLISFKDVKDFLYDFLFEVKHKKNLF